MLYSIRRYNHVTREWDTCTEVYGKREAKFTLEQLKTANPLDKFLLSSN